MTQSEMRFIKQSPSRKLIRGGLSFTTFDYISKSKKFNAYAKTREECEAELAEMIEQKKKEIAALKKKAKTA